MQPVGVGIIGCGNVLRRYMATKFPAMKIVSCFDQNPDRARRASDQYGFSSVPSAECLLADPAVEIVLNLTPPSVHASVSLAAARAGKHVYSEKPLGVSREEGAAVLQAACDRGVRVGCAPDSFLSDGMQTARSLIDEGAIGRPVGFTAFMLEPGHEYWHPDPEIFYQPGGGPMFDMGPYYLTALVTLLGQPARVFGLTTTSAGERTVRSQARSGQTIPVLTPDHVTGIIEFEQGATGAIMTSFAAWHSPHPPLTIFGTEGTLAVPDPNRFDGGVQLSRRDQAWSDVPPRTATGHGRGIGLAEMAVAIRSGRPHRASGELAFCVLDMIQGFYDSCASGVAHRPVPCPSPEVMRRLEV